MQFFQAIIRAEQANEDVLNTLWYRRDSVGLPTQADQQALADHIIANGLPKFRPLQTPDITYRSVTVYSYNETWQRTPYLPTIVDTTGPGTGAGPAGPPLLVAIISFRVEPVAVDPTTSKAVRRGYLAMSGIAEADFGADGRLAATFRTAPAAATLLSWLSTPTPISTAAENVEPIRVSKPPLGSDLRGYGRVMSAQFREAASTRRTRKLGKGG